MIFLVNFVLVNFRNRKKNYAGDHSFFLSGAGEILSLEISKIILSAEVSGENFQNVQKQSTNHYF